MSSGKIAEVCICIQKEDYAEFSKQDPTFKARERAEENQYFRQKAS